MVDATLLEMAHLKVGDPVNLEVHGGGTITVTPLRPQPSPEDVTRTIRDVRRRFSGEA